MVAVLEGSVTVVSDVQFSNTESSIVVTELGIVTLERLVQPEKAESRILVTLEGIVTLPKLEHPRNNPIFNSVALDGNEIVDKLVQLANAYLPKGIVPNKPLQSTDTRLVQPLKAFS